MDNVQGTPMIPAGTEKTVWGTNTFSGTPSDPAITGQVPNTPVTDKIVANEPQQVPQAPAQATSYEELAAKAGFKSPDDLATAYQELRKQNTKVQMSLAELVKMREIAEVPSPTPASDVQTPEEAVKIVESLIAKRVRPLEDKIALQELFYKNQDASQYATAMAQVVKENPGVSWDTAYKAAKFDALEEKSREQGRQEAYQAIQQKQSASVGPAGRPAQKDERGIIDIINDRSIPFQEVQKIMHERFRV